MADSDYMYAIVPGADPKEGALAVFDTAKEAESWMKFNSPGDVNEDGTLRIPKGYGPAEDEPNLAIVRVLGSDWDDPDFGFSRYSYNYKED